MIRTLASVLLLSALPLAANAGPIATPEPGILLLLGAGGVVMLALYLLRRRQ